jgi:glycerol-3-phosphate O-acyltransferase
VLARYVQMATEGGVTQALFPEGGLSLDGKLAPPKLGLLNYIVNGVDLSQREVVMVPVAVNYDHVLEDRILIAAKDAGSRHFHAPFWSTARSIGAYVLSIFTRRFRRFGTATVSFGAPLTLSEFLKSHEGDPTEVVAEELMHRISDSMPVMPVGLVARALLSGCSGAEIAAHVERDLKTVSETGATLPRRDTNTMIGDVHKLLKRRDLVDENWELAADAPVVLGFYANSIAHFFDPTLQGRENSASAK